MELVGSFLGHTQDKALFEYFRRHWNHFFPALKQVHRTTFIRQATNLWVLKERLGCWLRDEVIRSDPSLSLVDSLPIPVCRFACAHRSGAFPRDCKRRERSYRSADLFWLSLACPTQLARSDHSRLFGSCECCGRRNGSAAAGRNPGSRFGGSQLLASGSASVLANQRHRVASALSQGAFAQRGGLSKFGVGGVYALSSIPSLGN